MEPTTGLPSGLGQTHRPQHEGRDQAGIYAEALLSSGDGWRSLPPWRNGNPCQTVLKAHVRALSGQRKPWIMVTSLWLGSALQSKGRGKKKLVSYPIKGRQEKGGVVKSVAGWKSLAPHASHLNLFIQIFTVNSREISFTWTDADILNIGGSCVVLHCFLDGTVFAL